MRTYTYDAEVTRWVDGDTVWLDVDLGFRLRMAMDFRLDGLDTPERGKAGYAEASATVREAAPIGTTVNLISKKQDKYGRWLAVITVPGVTTSINALLLNSKLAVPYSGGKK